MGYELDSCDSRQWQETDCCEHGNEPKRFYERQIYSVELLIEEEWKCVL